MEKELNKIKEENEKLKNQIENDSSKKEQLNKEEEQKKIKQFNNKYEILNK